MFTAKLTSAPSLAPGRLRRPPGAGRLAQRLAGSSLVGALAAPHGVDRYVELVRPDFSLRKPRAEVETMCRDSGISRRAI